MSIKTLRRAVEIFRQEGARTLLEKSIPFLYEQLWPYLPKSRERVTLNGVESSHHKSLLDKYLPSFVLLYVPTDETEYERQYISGIHQYLDEGDDVVAIGGGEGISTVIMAKNTGDDGEVHVFEGSAEEYEKTKTATHVNGVSDCVTVHHAIVAKDFSLRNSPKGADVIDPCNLPKSDVLAIDADGAEIPILENISYCPDKLIIEHHEVRKNGEKIVEYQPNKVRDLIETAGYEITEELADPSGAYDQFEERIFLAEKFSG